METIESGETGSSVPLCLSSLSFPLSLSPFALPLSSSEPSHRHTSVLHQEGEEGRHTGDESEALPLNAACLSQPVPTRSAERGGLGRGKRRRGGSGGSHCCCYCCLRKTGPVFSVWLGVPWKNTHPECYHEYLSHMGFRMLTIQQTLFPSTVLTTIIIVIQIPFCRAP